MSRCLAETSSCRHDEGVPLRWTDLSYQGIELLRK
ncbi:hypothetical protein AAKU61_004478 [Undibacterium sp. GrIS 1.2]